MDQVVTADRGDAGRRLDVVVQRRLGSVRNLSRTRVQGWIEHGCVSVNGATIRRAAARVAAGDLVAIREDTPERIHDDAPHRPVEAEPVPLDVLYEDEHLIAVNKPAGLVVHPTYRHESGTLLNGLFWRARSWPAGRRPSIVGRLDKLTSGLVVAAKSAAVHAALQRAVASPRCRKEYLAVVYGRVKAVRGEIALRLARDPHDRRRVVASETAGAPSLTRFERLGRLPGSEGMLSLVRCELATGRMHQIRVHLAARGWPLVGDPKYGAPGWEQIHDPALAAALKAFPRQALHAARLELRHPITGKPLRIGAPLAADLSDLLSVVRSNAWLCASIEACRAV